MSEPIFEIIEPDGKRYGIFQNGMVQGFHEDAFIVNGIATIINHLCGAATRAKNALQTVAPDSPAIETLTSAINAAQKHANLVD